MSEKEKRAADVIKAFERVENTFVQSGYYEKYKKVLELTTIMNFLKIYYTIGEKYKKNLFSKYKLLDKNIDYNYYLNGEFSNLSKLYVNQYKKLSSAADYNEFCKIPFEVEYD